MARGKGKKLKNIGQSTGQPDANKKIKKKKKARKVKATHALLHDPTSFSDPEEVRRSGHATNSFILPPRFFPDSATAQGSVPPSNGRSGKEKDMDYLKLQLPGFIFMCNGRTKPECYQYRVFGLPMGQQEVVEKIKPGAKLFLYDFDQKLLYGVYNASTQGALNLEPAAFEGRFPAQVRFEIFEESLPLDEGSLRRAIHDNYHGNKFKQELNGQQVKNLLSMFRPFSVASTAPMPLPMPRMGPPMVMLPPSAYGNQHHHQPSVRMPPRQDPFGAGMHRGRAPLAMEPLHIQQNMTSQHESYTRPTTTRRPVRPNLGQQYLPPTHEKYYPVDIRQPPPHEQHYPADTRLPPPNDPYYPVDIRQPPPHEQYYPADIRPPPPHEQHYPADTRLPPPNDPYYPGDIRQPPPHEQYYPADIRPPRPHEQHHHPADIRPPPPNDPYYPVDIRQPPPHEQYYPADIRQPPLNDQYYAADIRQSHVVEPRATESAQYVYPGEYMQHQQQHLPPVHNDPYLAGASTQGIQDPNARYRVMGPPHGTTTGGGGSGSGSLVQGGPDTVVPTSGPHYSMAGGGNAAPVSAYYSYPGATDIYQSNRNY